MNDVIGHGADGAIKGENVMLDRVSLGDKTVERLPAIVLNSGNQSLLGQSFLSKFASVTMRGDKMVLR
jgi:clan AA aspartic protease (TIGR02281 family)